MDQPIYSPGLEGIVAGETAISTISDGLRYRGYSIEELAEHSSFEEVAYLVLYGELPTRQQLDAFGRRVRAATKVDERLIEVLRKIPPAAPMMDVMRSGASLLAHWDPDIGDDSHDANLRKAERLLAQLPVVMAVRHRLRSGQQPIPADENRTLAENILWTLRGEAPSQLHVRAMDVSLILYAEHEFNASTFTARVICSTLSDIHSSVTGAIGALKGPLHGGANERVMDILTEVGSSDRAEAWIREALARKTRIMGFGHRVYKTGDLRARILKPFCRELAAESGNEDMEKAAETIEQIVVAEKQLPPNLDWPSGRMYHYMGLPVDLYTPLFVVSRVVGWSAHVIEQLDNNRLIRPRARYTGREARTFVPISKRK